MDFPPSRSLPLLIETDEWRWLRASASHDFWVADDPAGRRWFVKMRGGFRAVRERAYSVLAQALDISCQSSAYLLMQDRTRCLDAQKLGHHDRHQLALWFFDRHGPVPCSDECPFGSAPNKKTTRELLTAEGASIGLPNVLDWCRGEILGFLCDQEEPSDRLFTPAHKLVLIDNELMFAPGVAELHQCRWIFDDHGVIPKGLDEARRVCRALIALPDDVFAEALRLPPGYRPKMRYGLKRKIDDIRPRARHFLKWTGMLWGESDLSS